MPEFKDLRPSEILELFWRETLSIEEDALFMEPVYWEADR